MTDRGLHVALRQTGPIPLDVTFDCGPGEALAIFGPSGSGKSTIVRTIAGLYRPSEAVVRCGGEVWADTTAGTSLPPHRRRVGLVFQDYALFPHMTARANIEAALGHVPRAERGARADQLLAVVHLSSRADRRPSELSGGEQQRVAVARALARDPHVLLLDEPFAAVDRSLRRRLQDQVAEVRQNLSIPIVLVTHDFEDVVRLASHLLVLQHGTGVCQGPLHTLASRPDLSWLRESIGLGSIIDTQVTHVDEPRRLVTLGFDGGSLVAPNSTLSRGASVRVRVPAREVILATSPPTGVSLHNVLRGVVTSVYADEGSDHAVVQLGVGATHVLAEVTQDAVTQLGIRPGTPLHALIKAVSLEVQPTPRPAPVSSADDRSRTAPIPRA